MAALKDGVGLVTRTGQGSGGVELESSTWTRRDRLERIADAERDRRAGRVELAIASLGEALEWPARLVLALAKLPEEEGGAARLLLESTLDDWARDSGLTPLDGKGAVETPGPVRGEGDRVDGFERIEEPGEPVGRVTADRVARGIPDELEPPSPSGAAPDPLGFAIEFDELERAFAEAEAQTEEMHGVNDIAARVLGQEPLDLAEIDDAGPLRVEASSSSLAPRRESGRVESGVSAQFAADAAWGESSSGSRPAQVGEGSARGGGPVESILAVHDRGGEGSSPKREHILSTLERWLDNLRAGRA